MVNVAIVGATGAVGEVMIELLQQREFPVDNLYLLASSRSAGKRIMFNNKSVLVTDLAEFDFNQVQVALFSAGGTVSAEHAPRAAATGCVVIDNTSHFRYEADIPLIVPEVNLHALAQYENRNIIANPNCSTIQMLVALQPIYEAVGIDRINVATYQAVSGAGQSAVEALAKETAHLLNGNAVEQDAFPQQIAFNVLPQIDKLQENGYTREEMKMIWETQKILEDPDIKVNPTCVRVPVFYGHAEAIHIETSEKINVNQVRHLLYNAPGVKVIDQNEDYIYPTPVTDAAGQDATFVGRIRKDVSHPLGINLWVVADNLRKGAALNSIQIAEHLLSKIE